MVDIQGNRSEASTLPLKLVGATVRKRGKTILEDINAEIHQNGFTVVMGPNGSGKTTLLRLMHGLERLRSGSAKWAISDQQARGKQSFVFQIPVMMRRSVLDNISYPLVLRGVAKAQARKLALQWADRVGLQSKVGLEALFLSGGERQKLAIARALITEPHVLFLDEPTTNLDGQSIREIETIIRSAHEGGTRIIMTTHDIGQAKRLANDVLFLNRGRLCEQSTAVDFFTNPQSDTARAYLRGDVVE